VSFVCKLFFGYARDQEIWISLSRIEYTFVELFNVPNSFLPNPRTIIPELYSASSDHRKKVVKLRAFKTYLSREMTHGKNIGTQGKTWRNNKLSKLKTVYRLILFGEVDIVSNYLQALKNHSESDNKKLLEENKIALTRLQKTITISVLEKDTTQFSNLTDFDDNPIIFFLFDVTNKMSFKRLYKRISESFPVGFKSVIIVVGDTSNVNTSKIAVPAEKSIQKFKQRSIPYIEVSSEKGENFPLLLDYLFDCLLAIDCGEIH